MTETDILIFVIGIVIGHLVVKGIFEQ